MFDGRSFPFPRIPSGNVVGEILDPLPASGVVTLVPEAVIFLGVQL